MAMAEEPSIDYSSICDNVEGPKKRISATCVTFNALLSDLKMDFWIPTFEEANIMDIDAFRGHEDGQERLIAQLEDAGVDTEHTTRIIDAVFAPLPPEEEDEGSSLFSIERVTLNQDAVDQDRAEHAARVEATRIKWLADKAAKDAAEAEAESEDEEALDCSAAGLTFGDDY